MENSEIKDTIKIVLNRLSSEFRWKEPSRLECVRAIVRSLSSLRHSINMSQKDYNKIMIMCFVEYSQFIDQGIDTKNMRIINE